MFGGKFEKIYLLFISLNYITIILYILGATGDTGKYCITSDTYQLDLNSKSWKKLDSKFIFINLYIYIYIKYFF